MSLEDFDARLEKAASFFAPKDKDLEAHIKLILNHFVLGISNWAIGSENGEINENELKHVIYQIATKTEEFPYFPQSWPTHSQFLTDCMRQLALNGFGERTVIHSDYTNKNFVDVDEIILPSMDEKLRGEEFCMKYNTSLINLASQLPACHFDITQFKIQFASNPKIADNKAVMFVGYFIGDLDKNPKLTDYISEEPPCVELIFEGGGIFKPEFDFLTSEYILAGKINKHAKIRVLSLVKARDLPEDFIKLMEKYRS